MWQTDRRTPGNSICHAMHSVVAAKTDSTPAVRQVWSKYIIRNINWYSKTDQHCHTYSTETTTDLVSLQIFRTLMAAKSTIQVQRTYWYYFSKNYCGNKWSKTQRTNCILHQQQEHPESADIHQCQNLKQKWPGIWIRIFGLIRMWMSVGSVQKFCGCIILSISVILPSKVQIGRWLYEKC